MGRIVLGIDPGFGRVGFGVVEEGGRDQFKAITYGCIETDPNLKFVERLQLIEKELKEIIKKFNPELVVVEQLFFTKNISTGINVAHARGVILLTIVNSGLRLVEIGPKQVKQTLTGYGNAEKIQMQKMVQMQLRLKEIPKPDDAADALALALVGFFC